MRSVLLLADDKPGHAATVLDHIESLSAGSRHSVHLLNPVGFSHSRLLCLDEFEVVVIHYSLVLILDYYLPPWLREQLRNYRGLKIQFIQDEMRWVDRMRAMMKELRIDLVFSVAGEAAERLYGHIEGLEIVTCLTGYVPRALVGLATPALAQRPLDVGYRGRSLPYWLGALSQEKRVIGERFKDLAPSYGLVVDIGWQEEDRIYGQAWHDFLCSARATLASESGASISDFDGSLEQGVTDILDRNPEASFDEVSRLLLAAHEENLPIRAISPRIFEAVALGCALVLFPGEYSGIIRPHEHYIPLEKDFSNIAQVTEKLKNLNELERMTARAYQDLIASDLYSYAVLSRLFDDTIDRRLPGAASQRPATPWRFHLSRLERWWLLSAHRARLVKALCRLRTYLFEALRKLRTRPVEAFRKLRTRLHEALRKLRARVRLRTRLREALRRLRTRMSWLF